MIHPEKARIETVAAIKREKERALRVGDEHEVELLPGRAAPIRRRRPAIVDGRVTEVENAANSAGNFVRIRILDVDGEQDYILARWLQPVRNLGANAQRGVPRSQRPSRPVSLRELAEDAARQSAARPPIGITSLTEEEEAQDKP